MLKFIKKHTWLLIVMFLLVLFPQSLTDQAKLNMRVIITGIGVDYIDNQYQITSQLVLPENGAESGGISARISYISSKGKSISECVQNTSYKLGKFTELSHVEFILVGETMKDHNLAGSLDYFFRNFKLKKSITLLTCLGTAKSAIMKSSELELGVALSLQKIYLSHERSLSAVATSYIDFICESHLPSGTSVIDTFMVSAKDTQDSEQESGDESGSNPEEEQSSSAGSSGNSEQSNDSGSSPTSSQSDAGESAQILLFSPLILFKDGLYYGKFEKQEEILGYYLTNNKSRNGNIFVTNFSYGEAQNLNFNIRIDQMHVNHKIEWSNNKPIHKIDITIDSCKIDELASANSSNTLLYKYLDTQTQQQLLCSAKNKICELVCATWQTSKNLNFDIFQTANLGNKFCLDKWNKFIDGLDNPLEYVQEIQVVTNVKFGQIS